MINLLEHGQDVKQVVETRNLRTRMNTHLWPLTRYSQEVRGRSWYPWLRHVHSLKSICVLQFPRIALRVLPSKTVLPRSSPSDRIQDAVIMWDLNLASLLQLGFSVKHWPEKLLTSCKSYSMSDVPHLPNCPITQLFLPSGSN